MQTEKLSAIFVIASIAIAVFSIDGCTYNPLDPPDLSRPTPTSGVSSGGGTSNASASSGEGGVGGMACVCPDDNDECTIVTEANCPNGDVNACSQTIAFGAKCSNGGCNEQGECVDCLMCDSPECFARCEKMACSDGAQCVSGHCEDKTCCKEECAGPCKACDRPGTEGACTRMPQGLAVCDPGSLCDHKGQCMPNAKVPLGGLCMSPLNCASGLCRREYCQSQNDEPCVEHIECTTNLCDPITHTCKSCIGANAASCPTGTTCNTQYGWCTVLPGQPAGSNEECSSGKRLPHRCALPEGAACTSHDQCIYRNCLGNGDCSGLCTQAGQCVAGTACDVLTGACKLPVGSYCIVDSECQFSCGGFPRRCQPQP